VDQFSRNLDSLWDTSTAFGASPGFHKKLVNNYLSIAGHTEDPYNLTIKEITVAEEATNESVKAALLMSGEDKKRFGSLKKELANDYLKGSNNYPNTVDKAK